MSAENQKTILNSLLSNGHLQTIWTSTVGKRTLRKASNVFFNRTRFKTPDNDFLDFDWLETLKKKGLLPY
jgi:predicted alpha/beta-fold hydrolase